MVFSCQRSPTPGNVEQVIEVEELISLFCHQILGSRKITLLYKTLIAASFAIAYCVILNCTNTELLTANTQKKQRAQHNRFQ